MIGEPNPFQFTTGFRNGLDYIPEDGKGKFQLFTGSFRKALNNPGKAGYPFIDAKCKETIALWFVLYKY